MGKKKVTLSIEAKTYNDFQKHCKENAIMLSKRIELFMQSLIKDKKHSLYILFILFFALFIGQVSAAQISNDNFECDGFNCGSGWNGAWSTTGGCSIETLGQPLGTYHMRGVSSCDASRSFDNSAYSKSNVSFYASADSLESGEFCRYYYYNGTSYIEIFYIADGQDETPHTYHEFDVTLYGLSSNAQIRMTGGPSTGDYCEIDNVSITGFGTPDTTPPSFSNYIENPTNGSAYVSGQMYRFNATITEANSISSVGIEFNGLNYSATNISNVYMFNISNLAAGTYPYYWWANDSNGNYNTSGIKYYTINKSAQSITPFLNGNNANLNIIYPQQVNTSFSGTNQTALIIKINGIQINIGQNYTFGAGNWLVNYSMQSNENYTSFETYLNLTISKATPSVNYLLNGQSNITITYPQQVNASGSVNAGTLAIYRDGIAINRGQNYTLAAGYYRFDFNVTGNQNYTNISYSLFANVTKASSQTGLTFDKTSSQIYGEQITPTCSVLGGEESATLKVNGTTITSGMPITLGAGIWTFNCSLIESGNYTASENISLFTINKAAGNVSLLLNGTDNNLSAQYPQQINASASTLYGTLTLYRNGIDVTSQNGINVSLGVDYYNYTAVSSGNQNYSSATISYFANVTKGINAVSLLLNGISDNITITYLQELNASVNSFSGNIKLYRNGLDVSSSNNQNVILGAGNYTYKANATGNQNYSDNTDGVIFYVNVNKVSPNSTMEININPSENVTYGISTTTTTAAENNNGDSDLSYKLYRNGSLVASVSPWPDVMNNPNADAYIYEYNTTGGQNYTSGSVNKTLVVNKAGNPITLLLNGNTSNLTVQYPQQVNASAYSISGIIRIYREGSLIDNGQNYTLSVGYHQYLANSSGNQNYLTNSTGIVFYVNITPAADLGAPIVIINFPNNNSFLNMKNVVINYTPDDVNLDSCELWGNFSEVWGKNQTNSSLTNYQSNKFDIGLEDGSYLWAIRCNDTQGNFTFTDNMTLTIDTASPNLALSEPSGAKTSKSNIPLEFNANDLHLQSCWYNVIRGVNIEVQNTSINCNSGSITFNVTIDANFVLTLYANDSAGNLNFTTSTFSSVSTSPGNPPGGGSGGGGAGGSGGGILPASNKTSNESIKVEFINLNEVIMSPGESKTIPINLKNIGKTFLNKCKLTSSNTEWLGSADSKNINVGEIAEYLLTIKAPLSANQNDSPSLELICLEKDFSVPLKIIILQSGLHAEIKNMNLISASNLEINYDIVGNSNFTENLLFAVYDSENNLVSEKEEEIEITNERAGKSILLNIEKASKGLLKIIIAKADDKTSLVEEFFVYDTAKGITGLAFLDKINKSAVYIILIFIIFGFISYLILKRIIVMKKWQYRHKIS